MTVVIISIHSVDQVGVTFQDVLQDFAASVLQVYDAPYDQR